MGYQAEDVADLIASVDRHRERMSWVDLAPDIPNYTAFPMLMKRDKVKVLSGGRGHEWNYVMDDNGQATATKLGASKTYNQVDVTVKAHVPWRHVTSDWTYEEREVAMCTGREQIFDYIELQRVTGMQSLASILEQYLWSNPPSNTDDTVPVGIPYLIPKHSVTLDPTSATTVGLFGRNPVAADATTFSTHQNIDSDSYDQYRNYAVKWDGTVTQGASVRLLRTLMRKTNWKSPVSQPHLKGTQGEPSFQLCMNLDTLNLFEEYAENQNDQLGFDALSGFMRATIKRFPLTWVPYLDSDTSNPIYGIDWRVVRPIVLRGEFLKRSKPRILDTRHRTVVQDIDITINFEVLNRRQLFVMSKTDIDGN